MIRILLVEDHASFRQALAVAFDVQPDLQVVAEAGTIDEARALLAGVDVAVVDLDLPDGVGTELIGPLRTINPNAQVLVLTASANQHDIARAVELGASGALHKSANIADILRALRRLSLGELLWSPAELVALMRLAGQERQQRETAQAILAQLTPREVDVLRALGGGMSDREIAAH
ncbi:MAG: response regulator transcription factor, partial [Thermomicrobiales bacterium]|nr:response regulator transcription factor [Thermomicrobiales bacterium]